LFSCDFNFGKEPASIATNEIMKEQGGKALASFMISFNLPNLRCQAMEQLRKSE